MQAYLSKDYIPLLERMLAITIWIVYQKDKKILNTFAIERCSFSMLLSMSMINYIHVDATHISYRSCGG